jgi:alcohol dehydrogenase class IV
MIHHAGEQLSSQVKVSHPMSLIVFYDTVMSHYSGPCDGKYRRMVMRINTDAGDDIVSGIQDIIDLWNGLFDHYGITEELRKRISGAGVDVRVLSETVFSDRTWVEKESPAPLSFADVSRIITSSLGRYRD